MFVEKEPTGRRPTSEECPIDLLPHQGQSVEHLAWHFYPEHRILILTNKLLVFSPHLSVGFFFSICLIPLLPLRFASPAPPATRSTHTETTPTETTHTERSYTQRPHTPRQHPQRPHTQRSHTETTHTETTPTAITQRSHTHRDNTYTETTHTEITRHTHTETTPHRDHTHLAPLEGLVVAWSALVGSGRVWAPATLSHCKSQ